VTGLGFSRVGPGLIRHDLTDKEATLLLIRTIRPHLGNSIVSLNPKTPVKFKSLFAIIVFHRTLRSPSRLILNLFLSLSVIDFLK
jgi:hypothetical protein